MKLIDFAFKFKSYDRFVACLILNSDFFNRVLVEMKEIAKSEISADNLLATLPAFNKIIS